MVTETYAVLSHWFSYDARISFVWRQLTRLSFLPPSCCGRTKGSNVFLPFTVDPGRRQVFLLNKAFLLDFPSLPSFICATFMCSSYPFPLDLTNTRFQRIVFKSPNARWTIAEAMGMCWYQMQGRRNLLGRYTTDKYGPHGSSARTESF